MYPRNTALTALTQTNPWSEVKSVSVLVCAHLTGSSDGNKTGFKINELREGEMRVRASQFRQTDRGSNYDKYISALNKQFKHFKWTQFLKGQATPRSPPYIIFHCNKNLSCFNGKILAYL